MHKECDNQEKKMTCGKRLLEFRGIPLWHIWGINWVSQVQRRGIPT